MLVVLFAPFFHEDVDTVQLVINKIACVRSGIWLRPTTVCLLLHKFTEKISRYISYIAIQLKNIEI